MAVGNTSPSGGRAGTLGTPPSPQRVDVVVVDDDPSIRTTLVTMLGRMKYSALGVEPKDDVAARILDARPALLVLDLSLGKQDAIEVLRVLGRERFTGRVLLVSGHGADTIKRVQAIGVRAGLQMLGSLEKPVSAKDLSASLTAARLVGSVTAPAVVFDIGEALSKKWLELWYQPKVNLKTRRMAGAEALLRLRHPQLGVVSPASFIPSAESDAYEAMTSFVVDQAARDAFEMRRHGWNVPIAINASISMVQRPVFLDMIRDAWRDPAGQGRLTVEITEDDIVTDIVLAQEVATQLKLHFVDISIDDFGAGYSSFARLRDLPFVELKLDRSFVMGVAQDPKQRAFCVAAGALARQFEIASVAEGIETAEELAVMQEAGFDIGQGFYFARPKPPIEFVNLLTRMREKANRQSVDVSA